MRIAKISKVGRLSKKEIVLLGIASALPNLNAPTEYPVQVGLLFPDSGHEERIWINPPEAWNLIKMPKLSHVYGKKPPASPIQQYISHSLVPMRMLLQGVPPRDAYSRTITLLNGRMIFSIGPHRIRNLLEILRPQQSTKPNIRSLYKFLNQFTDFKTIFDHEIAIKLDSDFRPYSDADVAWMAELLHRCGVR